MEAAYTGYPATSRWEEDFASEYYGNVSYPEGGAATASWYSYSSPQQQASYYHAAGGASAYDLYGAGGQHQTTYNQMIANAGYQHSYNNSEHEHVGRRRYFSSGQGQQHDNYYHETAQEGECNNNSNSNTNTSYILPKTDSSVGTISNHASDNEHKNKHIKIDSAKNMQREMLKKRMEEGELKNSKDNNSDEDETSSTQKALRQRLEASLQQTRDKLESAAGTESTTDASFFPPLEEQETDEVRQRCDESTSTSSPTSRRRTSESDAGSRQETPEEAFLKFRTESQKLLEVDAGAPDTEETAAYPSLPTNKKAPEQEEEQDVEAEETPTGRSRHTWGGNPDSDDEEYTTEQEADHEVVPTNGSTSAPPEWETGLEETNQPLLLLERNIFGSSPVKKSVVNKPVVSQEMVTKPAALMNAVDTYPNKVVKSPLRRDAITSGVNGLKKKQESAVCRFWRKGNCVKGKYCEWAHRMPDEEQTPALEVKCDFWKSGVCERGDNCPWLHVAPGRVSDPFSEQNNMLICETATPALGTTSTTGGAGASMLKRRVDATTTSNSVDGNLLKSEVRHQNKYEVVEAERLHALSAENEHMRSKLQSLWSGALGFLLCAVLFGIGYFVFSSARGR